MKNYKFDNAVTNGLIDVCQMDEKSENQVVLLEEIARIKNIFGESFLVQNSKACGKQTLSIGRFSIDRINAFSDGELDNLIMTYNEFEKEYNSMLFQLESLKIQLHKAKEEMNISRAVVISDKISELNSICKQLDLECEKINQFVCEKQKEYIVRFDDFLVDLKKGFEGKEVYEIAEEYGCVVMADYIRLAILNLVKDYIGGLNDEEKSIFLESEKLKDVLSQELSFILDEI